MKSRLEYFKKTLKREMRESIILLCNHHEDHNLTLEVIFRTVIESIEEIRCYIEKKMCLINPINTDTIQGKEDDNYE